MCPEACCQFVDYDYLFIGLHKVGLVFEGREHSGIEDARNTARLVRPIHIPCNPLFFFIQVWKMVSDGCLLEQTGRTETEREKLQHQLAHRFTSTQAKVMFVLTGLRQEPNSWCEETVARSSQDDAHRGEDQSTGRF